jgi:hypothetical protein
MRKFCHHESNHFRDFVGPFITKEWCVYDDDDDDDDDD